MSKIILTVLTAAAFFYAAWLVIFRRQLPDPKQTKGLRRRFILATLLFVGLFSTVLAKDAKEKSDVEVMCYSMAAPSIEKQSTTRTPLTNTLKAVWQTLDPSQAEEFRNKLQAAADESMIRKKTANMLAIAFSEVAYHKKRTRSKGPQVTCYKMTPLGGALITTRENTLKQIELLQAARKSGKIDEQTSKKALDVLAREVEMLYRADNTNWPIDRNTQQQLIKEYSDDKLIASDSASVAAAIILLMEEAPFPGLTPAQRLSTMKDRVKKLLMGDEKTIPMGGPTGNDWMDPGIKPNVHDILVKAGVIVPESMLMVSCYDRSAAPVKARSEELKSLQKKLLDENVKAGVLTVEVAEKAIAGTDNNQIDYATEADIRDYQKKLRRIMRILYKHGELPSFFVEQIESAADIEIISFDPSKALRNDVGWHLRSLFHSSTGDDVIKMLEQEKLIPSARSLRRVMDWSRHNHPAYLDSQKKDMARFETSLNNKENLQLDEDKDITIKEHQLPQTDAEYKLEIRNVCRALIKAGRLHKDNHQLKLLEDLIGIPVVGTIEK